MDRPEPDITLDVVPRNPGQFFACCGVLEMATLLWPGNEQNGWRDPEGWFDGSTFHITSYSQTNDEPLPAIVRHLVEADTLVTRTEDKSFEDDKIAPLTFLPADPRSLRLDWWLKSESSQEANTALKLWSGQQKPSVIFADLHTALRALGGRADRMLLRERVPMTGRFGFDPGPAWDALDVGFSPNEQGIAVLTSPAAEILAAVGIQGFRPRRVPKLRSFAYATWTAPLSAAVARAAAAGSLSGRQFQFSVTSRGKYKAFDFAEEIEEKQS
ncbi:MAG TPA: hypothetical protein VHX61_02615 [Rhizomicrobium sp.]|jgi:CRISPR-associated protein Csb3|nr:hypothetical protein [Rhizomicrobium sp.]